MIPWLVLLAIQLPTSAQAAHWSTAWVGLDAMEAVGLLATGQLHIRRDDRRCLAAAITGTLILIDAWFDVTTALPGTGQLMSVALAVCIEIPVSMLCLALAVRTLPRHRPEVPPAA
jgi:hypothetical protein